MDRQWAEWTGALRARVRVHLPGTLTGTWFEHRSEPARNCRRSGFCLMGLCLGFDDPEIPAAVHEAQQVEHAVVVALLATWDRRVPQLFDEGFRNCAIGGSKARNGCGCQQARGVARRERFAIKGVTIDEVIDTLPKKELLDAVAELCFALVLVPPGVIDRPVAGGPPG